jgi:hypothetical protein
MHNNRKSLVMASLVVAVSCLAGPQVHADVVTDWSTTAIGIAVAGSLPAGGAYRAIAVVQTAVYEAVNAVTKRYPSARVTLQVAPGASLEAAVAAANRATLAALVPAQQDAIAKAYQAALATLPDGPSKTAGIRVGEQAATAILALCAGDGYDTPGSYRPHTSPGVYVPTILPDFAHWPGRKPWLLASADQFRPGPPLSLTSAVWARDYNEIKAVGGKQSSKRTSEQTAIARFWEARVPSIYLPVVLSLATAPGRELTQNARLLTVATQAMDDALIAAADAKYHYDFWRPITAIRNGDMDGNDATERDASWVPFIDTPMHPEYPCAHCILSATVATVLQAEVGGGSMPTLRATSPTAPGMERSWTTIEAFLQEVANARIYDGVHYRTSTEVGTAMGRKIGEWVAAKALRPIK